MNETNHLKLPAWQVQGNLISILFLVREYKYASACGSVSLYFLSIWQGGWVEFVGCGGGYSLYVSWIGFENR